METDSAHGNIERELKRRLTANSRLHTPSAAMEAIGSAIRAGYVTDELCAEDWYDWKDVHAQLMGNKSVPSMMKVRGISFTKVSQNKLLFSHIS